MTTTRTLVEAFVDPGCPWTWITSRWLAEVAARRDLELVWRSYSTAIRDGHQVPDEVPKALRADALVLHATSHRMLRVFEAVRAAHGDAGVDTLYAAWGERLFPDWAIAVRNPHLGAHCLRACGFDAALLAAGDDDRWDSPIVDSMAIAHRFGGPRTLSPTIVVHAATTTGFRGPVMAPAPTGAGAVALWDAIQVVAGTPGFLELSRPRSTLLPQSADLPPASTRQMP
jgi:2-hydroxychromene-2-carboxylate isomerase